MVDTKSALVLGATGGVGSETAASLLRHGWRVIALVRDRGGRDGRHAPPTVAGMQVIAGDAMRPDDVRRAAESVPGGVDAIVHAVNPPGYRNWAGLVLPMIDNTISAARAVGARIVLPGTVYNYGPDAFPVLREDAPQHPTTRKGRIRVELERRLEMAAADGGAPALILRCGDFFGPVSGGSWLAQGMVKPGRRLAAITDPGGRRGVAHDWAYLPDVAETIAQLLDRADDLAPFARFHFAGHRDPDGTAMPHAIAAAVGRPATPVRALPWTLIRLAGLVAETPREMVEMRYLWRTPLRLDNTALLAFLGAEPRTPLDAAVRATLRALDVS